MAISPTDRSKLAALLGMMGSDHDGEALNAARFAAKMVRNLNMTWEELLSPATQQIVVHPFYYHRPEPALRRPWQVMAAKILASHEFLLSEWETTFLTSISHRTSPLTSKQQASFDRILSKVNLG